MIRVVPLYWLLTLVMIFGAISPLGLFGSTQVHLDTAVKSLFFIPHYSKSWPEHIWPILVPGWTLNYEMFFYAVFAGSLLIKQSIRVFALASAFAALVGGGLFLNPTENPLVQTYTNPILLEFVFGALIAKFWLSGHLKLSAISSFCFFLFGAVLLVAAPLDGLGRVFGAVLMVAGVLNLWEFRISVAHALGDASYSIYLIHVFTLGVVRLLWIKVFPGPLNVVGGWGYMLTSLVVCAAVGWVCYYWIEHPITQSLHSRFS